MNTATAARSSVPAFDISHELMAGRPCPMRDALAPLNHATASALLEARRVWWLDVAIGFANLADAALKNGDISGAEEALGDHREAMASAAYYGRKSIGR